jgi:predicted  nucleic acid-binding Zn-ribbon protein
MSEYAELHARLREAEDIAEWAAREYRSVRDRLTAAEAECDALRERLRAAERALVAIKTEAERQCRRGRKCQECR